MNYKMNKKNNVRMDYDGILALFDIWVGLKKLIDDEGIKNILPSLLLDKTPVFEEKLKALIEDKKGYNKASHEHMNNP